MLSIIFLMSENEINHFPSDWNYSSVEERYDRQDGIPASPLSDPDDGNAPREGLTFNWFNLIIGVALFFGLTSGSNIFTDDWGYYPCLAIAVIIHELGHVVMGKSFGCYIQEMQVFFLSFVSYKPKAVKGGSSWRDIRWSLGVLPLGGVTVFKSRASDVEGMEKGSYIEDKAPWQQLLISAGGVLFNIATFLILYFAMPYMSDECYHLVWPLASLSLILAILNILPIYPLDGGAIVFSLYEIITGKKPSPKFTQACGWIGFVFIILFFWVFPEWLGGILHSIFGFLF